MKARSGRYIRLKKIAVGGMAEIFLARRLSFGGFARFVVIKRLLPEHQGRRAYEKLFLTEGRTQALLEHPNIVSVHDVGRVDDTYFIAMEYVHGVSGAELMAKAAHAHKPIPLGVALRIVLGMADALQHCHRAPDIEGQALGVLHHDISPHNVQLGFEGSVKLLDFGVATRMGRKAAGGRRGKFGYMSPEAIAKQPLDPRSDVYSLGVVLYEMTTGHRLYKGETADETRILAEKGEVPLPTRIDPYYPPSLEEVVLRALDRDRETRLQSAGELREAVAEVARRLGVDTTGDALVRYLSDLYGDEIEGRRGELARLARLADPRNKKRRGEVFDDPQSLGSLELLGQEPVDHPKTPTPSEIPELSAVDPEPSRPPAPTSEYTEEAELAPDAELIPLDESGLIPAVAVEQAAAPSAPPPPATPAAPTGTAGPVVVGLGLVAAVLLALVLGQPAGSPNEGRLRVESDPAGARVFDGERLLGVTPFEDGEAPLGTTYRLRVEHPGHSPWKGAVTLDPERPRPTVVVNLARE